MLRLRHPQRPGHHGRNSHVGVENGRVAMSIKDGELRVVPRVSRPCRLFRGKEPAFEARHNKGERQWANIPGQPRRRGLFSCAWDAAVGNCTVNGENVAGGRATTREEQKRLAIAMAGGVPEEPHAHGLP